MVKDFVFLKRIPRLYVEKEIKNNTFLPLDFYQSHYLTRVLRLQKGQGIRVFNEDSGEWLAILKEINRKNGVVIEAREFLQKSPLMIEKWLAFSLIKPHGLSFLLEKGTELGVTHFQPLRTEYSQKIELNPERFYKQVVAASQQCERLNIPKILPCQSFDNFLGTLPLISWHVGVERQEQTTFYKNPPIGCIVGPEGGWSEKEIITLMDHEAIRKVSLGPYILRAETAAIALLAQFLTQ